MKIYMKVVTVLILVVVSMSSGCALPTADEALAVDPSKNCYIRIESAPNGAKVYGVRGNNAGSLLGKTPFIFTYRYWFGNNYYGTAVNETLKYTSGDLFHPDLVVFRCLVIAEGCEPYLIRENINPNLFFNGGNITFTAIIKQVATQKEIPTQQQQQQQQQTVVIPGGESDKKKVGKVIVTSNVENAEIFVDGIFVGNTPANLKLKDGIHIIEVKKDGYKSYKRELRVLGDSESSIRTELEKE